MWLTYPQKRVSNEVLPHFRTTFQKPPRPQRHPMDEKYLCGFDPFGKTLKQCVEHWQTCRTEICQIKAVTWRDLKDQLIMEWRARR